jgi:hypothetical protein
MSLTPFAPNPDSAESQTHNEKLHGDDEGGLVPEADICTDRDPPDNVAAQQDDTHPTSQTKLKQNTNERPSVDSMNPYSHHYQPNAAIWAIYLKETEAEDKELAQLWQIGLDQLLIFVCQFLFSVPCIVLNYRRPVCSAQSSLLSSSKVARI